MDIQFGNLTSLNLLWIVAALAGLMITAAVLRRRALNRFATSNLVERLTSGISGPRRAVKSSLVITSLILLTVALTDPRWGRAWREVPQKGIDVMFVVDVSRSMLAEDATPSRLERARQQIGDMLDAMHGDRVGLVAFAGDVKQLSPLTTNYHDFKQTLAAIGPHSVPLGGSRLGDALLMAGRGFLDQTDDHKAIVVFSDGDDQESDPVSVAKQLHEERGIRVFTVGLGDENIGARIPVARTRTGTRWLEHNGEDVWSKMNGQELEQIASVADGAWIPAGTKQVDTAGVYRSYITNIEQADFETARIRSYIPRYQWFLGLALVLLVIESMLPDRRRKATSTPDSSFEGAVQAPAPRTKPQRPQRAAIAHSSNPAKSGKLVASAILLGVFSMGATSPATADDASTLVAEANAALTAGEYETAIADYRKAAELKPDRWEPVYNEAVAHYRNGDLPSARELFTRVLSSGDRELEAQARFNLANCDYADAVAIAQQDRPAAIAKLESAISHYRETLASNSADADARINTELASRLIEQLRQEDEEEQQQQESQQQQSEQDHDSQQNESSQGDQSQNEASQSHESQQNQSQQSDSQQQTSDSDDNSSSEEQSEQPESNQESGDDSSAEEQEGESDNGQQDPTQPEEKTKEDQETSCNASDSDTSDPSDQQDQNQSDAATGESAEAEDGKPQSQSADATPESEQQHLPEQGSTQAQPRSQQPESEGPTNGIPQYGSSTTAQGGLQPMTPIEADKMLQAIRDRDLRRRLEQQRAERQRSVPVDKDW